VTSGGAAAADVAASSAEALVAKGSTSVASMSDILLPNGNPVGFVKPGAGQNIQTVTSAQFTKIESQLMQGSTPVTTPSSYNGIWYQMSDDSVFGIRTSPSSGKTIDVIKSSNPSLLSGFKVHQQ
jgi:filamentous hemagglutinin